MKISRYFINQNLSVGKLVIKDKDLIHRLFVVLKYKTGEHIKLFNGQDSCDYLSTLLIISKKECFLEITEKINNDGNAVSKKINVYVAVVKSDFDEMLREMVEIGANEITPIISERVERKELNYERLNRIILEACEQSGRSDVPKLNGIANLFDFKDFSSENVYYHTEEVSQNKDVTQKISRREEEYTNIFIGPEGGWTEGEIKWFCDNGFSIRTLKTNILRAKTAAVVCLYDIINLY